MADCLSPEVELACNTWCNLSVNEAIKLITDAEAIKDYAFSKFISFIKEALKN